MDWWAALTIASFLFVPVAAWGWAGGFIENKVSSISPYTTGKLSPDFDYEARSDRLRVWRLRGALWGLGFGFIAAVITWLVR